ncbi:MAG: hypothetical protein AAF224_10850 [Pseudomonadota bacterium]
MRSSAFAATVIGALFLPGCSTLNLNLKSVADEIGEQQRRDQCIKEHKIPCPEEEFPFMEPSMNR